MSKVESEILIVGGGAAGMSAALGASEKASVTIVDDNPRLGGQIWRAELGKTKSPDALRLIEALEAKRIKILNNVQVFGPACTHTLNAETPDRQLELQFEKLIIATGARELFLPFPGWTLPGVFGAGGLQALVKGGLSVKNKRIVVAGTGPLLLAVTDYLISKGATVGAILEQASSAKLNRFGLGLFTQPAKLARAVQIKLRLRGVPYLSDSWVTKASVRSPEDSSQALGSMTYHRRGRAHSLDCDYLACGFHLIPSTEFAESLGCAIKDSKVSVNEFQQTTVDSIFCAGEPTGIAGVESSLIEGKVAGLAATGQFDGARKLFGQRNKANKFGEALNRTFALREELKTIADADTLVCRCEDVSYERLKGFNNFRDAKLQSRCGMGPCQGRVCGAATQFLFGWEPPNVRSPIFPVKMENL